MKNNWFKKLLRHWPWAAFVLFTLIAISYLLLQRGIYSFTDSGFYYQNPLEIKQVALSKLGQFSNTDGFYFGFDNSSMSFAHLFVTFYQWLLTSVFGSDLGQIVYYLIYYLVSFYFGKKLLAELLPNAREQAVNLGALFLVFNPFSLLIITLYTIGYIYAFFIAFAYFFLKYLKNGRMIQLLPAMFFGIYLLSYLRLVPIVGLTFILLLLVSASLKLLNPKRWLIFLAVFMVCAGPFFVSNILNLTSPDNVVSSYTTSFARYERANYNFKSSLLNSLSHPGGFTPSALSFYYNQRGLPGFSDNFAVTDKVEFYKIIQIIFNVGLLAVALYYRHKKSLLLVGLICSVIAVNTLGLFLSFSQFNLINSTVLIFLYNDYGFLQFTQSILTAILVAVLYHWLYTLGRTKQAGLFSALVLFYLLVNLTPVFSNHYGFKKVNGYPDDYKLVFTDQEAGLKEAALFVPYHWSKFSWSPYYLDVNSFDYSRFETLISPNQRFVGKDFVDFYNQIYDSFNKDNLSNLAILNLKNVIIFKDAETANKNIDTYTVINLAESVKKISGEAAKRQDLKVAQENQSVSWLRFVSADDYDFFIYSPKTLVDVNLKNFYETPFDLKDRPVIFDQAEFNAVNLSNQQDFYENSPKVSLKVLPHNSNKYLVRLSGVDKKKSFLLQFNQTYNSAWKIYFVSQKDFDAVSCQGAVQSYVLTNNEKCLASGISALDLKDYSLLFKDYLKPENHFRGNLLGNTFLFTPQSLPNWAQNGDELYLVIYFEKQSYYLTTLIFSAITFLLIMIAGLYLQLKEWRRFKTVKEYYD